jgi:hypothetical protein
MGDFSISPTRSLAENLAKGYIGVHIQQGVPLRDEDLNLLGDLVLAAARIVAAGYIGNGVAAGRDGFRIRGEDLDNDLAIRAGAGGAAGSCLVDGVEVVVEEPLRYGEQDDVDDLTAPSGAQPNPRTDIVFLDVWLADVSSDDDVTLNNPADVGVQTSTRIRPTWRVRVAEGSDVTPGAALPMPEPAVGHAHYPLARLVRPRDEVRITADMVTDLRQRNLTVADIENRVRYLEQTVLQPALVDITGQGRPFAPPVGAPGTVLRITGRNLRVGATAVLFGNRPAATVNPQSDSEITATVPSMPPEAVLITVTTGGGTVVTDDTFTVLPAVAGSPPTLAAPPGEFSPPLGASGTTVTIAGTGFDAPQLAVRFGTIAATVSAFTTTSVTAKVPPAATGPLRITVSTQFGTVTSINNFTAL